MKKILVSLISILFLVLLSFLAKQAIDYLFLMKTSSTHFFYSQCGKIWAHRGYSKLHKENSIESFSKAFDLGAKGIELDIFYDSRLDGFVVSHDEPYILINGSLLMLDDVFSTFGSSGYYWLDFKNLKNITEEIVNKSKLNILMLTEKYDVKNNIIIESTNINNLSKMTKAGFNTSYWISFNEDIGRMRYWPLVYIIKIQYILGYFSALSMNYKHYTLKLKESFSGIPFLLFTINEKYFIEKYMIDNSVKVILSDNNFYTQENKKCGI